MTLTLCSLDQFNCKYGSCVSIDKRCDGKVDCYDSSDEDNCFSFKTFPGYKKHLVPPPLGNSSKLLVNVSIIINQILDIDEIEGIFRVAFDLHTVWVDKRLRYMNLKESENLNTLTESEKQDPLSYDTD